MAKDIQVNIVMNKLMSDGLRELAWRRRLSMSELVRQLIEAELKRESND